MTFADTVRKNASTFKAMKKAGMLSEREVELLKLAGLDFDEQLSSDEQEESHENRKIMMLSKPVKLVQERLKY